MKIRILATSDIHGFIMPYAYSDNKLKDMGLAKVKSIIDKYRTDNCLVIDNGDILEGSPLLSYYYKKSNLKINPMAQAMNMCHYDYFNIGNHDFNYGINNLKDYIKHMQAKCLLANVKYKGEYIGNKYLIHKFDDNHQVALIGVVTHYIKNWEKPINLVDIEIEDAFECAKKTVEEIKRNEKVDAIILIYHGGYERDLLTGIETEALTSENQAYQMTKEIDGIDLLITGHQHRSFNCMVNGVATTQTAANGQEIALYDLDLDTKEVHTEILKPSLEADQKMLDDFSELEKEVQTWLDTKLGEVMNIDLEVKDEFLARLHKHPVISFINQVQMDAAQADLAGNALFNGAIGFKKNITMRDIVSTYVYPNTTVVYEINGKILKEYLEKSAEYFAIENDEIVVDRSFIEPKPQHFNYDMVDGIDYTIKVSNPVGSRITKLQRNGIDILDDDIFTLALSNYRASGGGNYFMFKNAKIVKEISEDMVTLIADYIEKHPQLYIDHHNNINVIK